MLMAPNACCRIQFFRRELGTEIVRDVDVMPVDPNDNLPPALLAMQPTLVLNGRSLIQGLPRRRRPGRIGIWDDAGPARSAVQSWHCVPHFPPAQDAFRALLVL